MEERVDGRGVGERGKRIGDVKGLPNANISANFIRRSCPSLHLRPAEARNFSQAINNSLRLWPGEGRRISWGPALEVVRGIGKNEIAVCLG